MRRATTAVLTVVVLLCEAAVLFRSFLFPESIPNSVLIHTLNMPPPDPPMTLMISCERGSRSGWTSYGGVDIPEGAIFVKCKLDEPFTYQVSSTEKEVAETRRRPEVIFLLAASGEVREAFLTRSSGSSSLDAKAMDLVTKTRYRATLCGVCRVVTSVPVDMKRRYP